MTETCLETTGRPLVVDADRALLRTSLFWEAFLALLSTAPGRALAALARLPHGAQAFRDRVFDQSPLDVATLPLDEGVVQRLRAEAAARPVFVACGGGGRRGGAPGGGVFLGGGGVGGAGRVLGGGGGAARPPRALAERLDLRSRVFASRGAPRRAALTEAFGEGGFDTLDTAPPRRNGARPLIKALRCHQWAKNLLIFVPALGAHAFREGLAYSVIAFISFSLCASSVYLTNDLLDLAADRAHPRKRNRPIATGALPIGAALVTALLLLAVSGGLALLLPPRFLLVLGGYYVLTLAYSVRLKELAIVDVMALACLYGARLMAGSAATGAVLSPWLEALSTFLFLSLALVKRAAELSLRQDGGAQVARRGYRPSDLPVLMSMAAASGYLSALVFALYVNSQDVGRLYPHPHRLWLICILILYWVSTVLLKTHRGEMHDDPVVFAFKDRSGWVCGLAGAAVVASALL